MEPDSPGEDVRDLPGATEERYQLEPQNGLDQNGPVREPCSPAAGATVGVDGPGMNGGGMRVPAPKLPPLRQDRHNAGVATPT